MQAGGHARTKASAATTDAGASAATEHADDANATIWSLYEFLMQGAKQYAENLSELCLEAAVFASLWDALITPTDSDLILNDDAGPLLHNLWN